MKFLSTCLIAAMAFGVSAATLIKDGKAAAVICVNAPVAREGIPFNEKVADRLSEKELAERTLRTAVDDLNYHFKKMSGATLPVKYNCTTQGTPAIILEIKADGANEEYFINSTKDKVVISGRNGIAITDRKSVV